ncbi:hypothetical protein DPMN_030824 [Dreissena polymorpha]|uniref:Uncharacterized protein n=1 Tax=Dreissena polymorpha TaxID=45954 RepID=A0A9D4RGI7_DREPO|nr:hypothetical protein DPMN_030824 [Dreissena polymorpha]
MNLLTKFHEDRTVNVASRVKNAPPLGSHFFQANIIIFELIQDIIETREHIFFGFTNLLTKFHEDWTINVASRVLTRKNAPPLVAKVHDEGKINVTSRVLTREIAPPLWLPYIIGMNLLTEFHEDRTINVASRVKNTLPLGGHVFQANLTIFELIQDIIGTNLLTKFHDDRKINVTSRVLTRKNAPPLGGHVFQANTINVASRVLTRKNAPPPGSHVFKPTGIIFELVQDIFGMNLLTKFHEDQAKMWSLESLQGIMPAPWWPYIIGINLLTKFHDDRKINVTSRVKNAPPLGSHVFQANLTICELIQNITETNLLTKFHEDWTINVASRELTSQMLTPHNARRTKGDHKSSP